MGSVSWYQGKQVFRFLRAPMVKSINTSQPLLRIVFQCNKRKKFWNFNYKYKFNIKKKHLQMLLVVYFHFWRQLLDAEVYWLPWAEEAIATVPGWIICIRKSNKILIKIYAILYKTIKPIYFCIEENNNTTYR